MFDYDEQLNNKNRKNRTRTAAIDGTSVRPGEPFDTSIPIIRVGASETKGMFRACSIDNTELRPPN